VRIGDRERTPDPGATVWRTILESVVAAVVQA
jgi:hypothetical protein